MLKDLSDQVKIFGSSQSVKPICPDSLSLNEIVFKTLSSFGKCETIFVNTSNPFDTNFKVSYCT